MVVDIFAFKSNLAAVTYGDNILIWGGEKEIRREKTYTDKKRLFIFKPQADIWYLEACTGTAPQDAIPTHIVQVVRKKMYAIGLCNLEVHVLDLESYHWVKLDTSDSGVPPLKSRPFVNLSGWVWQDKIYMFGGCGAARDKDLTPEQSQVVLNECCPDWKVYNNQVVAFNTATNKWEWPRLSGDQIPSPRIGHRCIIQGEYMLLSGGRRCRTYMNDLHALHMPTHRWSTLQTSSHVKHSNRPSPRSLHSFSLAGKNRAILYGGSTISHNLSKKALSDCWLLTWSIGRTGINDIKWNFWGSKNGQRSQHSSEYSAITSRLYLFGGLNASLLDDDEIPNISLLANPTSLLEASLIVANKHRVSLAHGAVLLPPKLRKLYNYRLHG